MTTTLDQRIARHGEATRQIARATAAAATATAELARRTDQPRPGEVALTDPRAERILVALETDMLDAIRVYELRTARSIEDALRKLARLDGPDGTPRRSLIS